MARSIRLDRLFQLEYRRLALVKACFDQQGRDYLYRQISITKV